MKTPSNHLFRLICSMSASEKRYFKLHFTSPNSHLTDLFDLLNSIDTYNEQLVKNYFSKNKIAKNLKVYKVQLKDILLKSLVAYYAKKNVRSKIRLGMEEVELLLEKELHEIAHLKIEKLINLAEKHHQTALVLSVLELKKRTLYTKGAGKEMLLPCLNHTRQSIENHRIREQLWIYINKLEELNNEEEKHKFSYEVILKDPILATNNNALNSFLCKKIKSDIKGYMQEDSFLLYQIKKDIVTQFKEQVFSIDSNYVYYFMALYDVAVWTAKLGKATEVMELVREMEDLFNRHKALLGNYPKFKLLILKLHFKAQKYSFIRAAENHQFLTRLLAKTWESDDSKKCLICYVLFEIQLKNWEKAHHLLLEIMNNNFKLNKNFNAFFNILEIIINYETKNIEVVNYLLSNYTRKIRKGKFVSPFIIAFVDFIQTIIEDKSQHKEGLIVFEKSIVSCVNDPIYQLWKEFSISKSLTLMASSNQVLKKGDRQMMR